MGTSLAVAYLLGQYTSWSNELMALLYTSLALRRKTEQLPALSSHSLSRADVEATAVYTSFDIQKDAYLSLNSARHDQTTSRFYCKLNFGVSTLR